LNIRAVKVLHNVCLDIGTKTLEVPEKFLRKIFILDLALVPFSVRVCWHLLAILDELSSPCSEPACI